MTFLDLMINGLIRTVIKMDFYLTGLVGSRPTEPDRFKITGYQIRKF